MRKLSYIFSFMLIFSIPWENSLTVVHLGTFTRVIGVLTAIVWLISVIERGRIRKINPIYIILLLFILWNISTVFWSTDTEDTVVRSKTYTQLGIMTLLFWDLYTTPKALNQALQAYVLGGYVSILGTLFISFAEGEMGGRYTASGFNPNDLSLVLVIGIPLAYHLLQANGDGRGSIGLKLVNLTYMPAAFIVLCLTASRGSLVASFPAILYIAVSIRRNKGPHQWLIFLAAVVFVFSLLPLMPRSNLERLASINESVSNFDLGGRTLIWQKNVNYFLDHPVLGVGSGVLSTHNVFLSVLFETGLIGLAIFITGLFFVLKESLKEIKRGELMWITLFCVWLLGALVHTWEDRKPTWLIFSFIMASGGLVVRNSTPLKSHEPDGIDYAMGKSLEKGVAAYGQVKNRYKINAL